MSGEGASSRLGICALITGVLLFSTVEVASKLMQVNGAVAGGNPFWLACFRSIVCGLLLAAPAAHSLRQRGVALSRRDVAGIAAAGLIGVTVMSGLFHMAITFLPANMAALIFSCNPVIVLLLAALFLSEKITARKIGAVVLCLCGILILARDRTDALSHTGILLMSGATLSFALYTVLCKKLIPRCGAPAVTAFAALTGGILLVPVAIAAEGIPFAAYGPADWTGLFYLAVFGTALGYFLYIYGIGHVGAGIGSTAFFLKPPAAALFAWMVLGETFSAREAASGLLILAGMVTALLPRGGSGMTHIK